MIVRVSETAPSEEEEGKIGKKGGKDLLIAFICIFCFCFETVFSKCLKKKDGSFKSVLQVLCKVY